jgi:hypothetical protein
MALSLAPVRGQSEKKAWEGNIPLMSLAVGAGAGDWLAYAVGAIETPFALLGAAGGYLLSGLILRRVYSRDE